MIPTRRVTDTPRPEPSLAEWKARCLLAQSLINHRLDTSSPVVQAVLAALRGDLALVGGE